MGVHYAICLLVFTVGTINAEGIITKCLPTRESQLRLKCPKGHVLYKPVAMVGVGKDGKCSRSRDDCTGMTETLQAQLERCYWRNRCFLALCREHAIDSGTRDTCIGQKPTYLMLHQPYCIPRDIVINMYDSRLQHINMTSGIIRSHVTYPRLLNTKRDLFYANILLKPSQTILLSAEAMQGAQSNSSQHLSVWKVYKKDKKKVSIKDGRTIMLRGNTTDMVQIKLLQRKGCTRGSTVAFSVYPTIQINELFEWPKSSFPIMRKMGCIFEVKAIIEQCTTNRPGNLEMHCGEGEIIFSPRVSMAGYTRGRPKCLYGRYPCGGYTPELMVQTHGCYWKNNCSLSIRRNSPIIFSSDVTCVGYVGSVLGFSGHSCIAQEKIHDVCTGSKDMVRDDWGILRSHDTYPWYFDSNVGRCKRRIKVGTGKRLLLLINDIELDPDGRDKFFVEHIYKGNRTLIISSKDARRDTQVVVEGGVVRIRFSPVRQSKAGRGFVLLFRRYRVGKIRRLPAVTYSSMETAVRRIQSDHDSRDQNKYPLPCRPGNPTSQCKSANWIDRFTGLQ